MRKQLLFQTAAFQEICYEGKRKKLRKCMIMPLACVSVVARCKKKEGSMSCDFSAASLPACHAQTRIVIAVGA